MFEYKAFRRVADSSAQRKASSSMPLVASSTSRTSAHLSMSTALILRVSRVESTCLLTKATF